MTTTFGRCVRKRDIGAKRLMFVIGSECGGFFAFKQHLRHRFDIGRVEFGEFIDVCQDLIEVMHHATDLVVGQAQVGQIGHIPNLLLTDFQAVAFSLAARRDAR